MRSTKRLVILLITLIICFISYLFVYDTDKTLSYINKIIDKINFNKIVIPEEITNHRTYSYETLVETKKFIPYSESDLFSIYYTVLNSGWNEFAFYCPIEYTNCVNDIKTFANDSKKISIINNYVSPYNSYKYFNTKVSSNNEIILSVEKLYTDEEVTKLKVFVDETIKRLNIDINNVKSTDIKNIHNYLIKYITYDDEHNVDDISSSSIKATGALLEGKAVCSGYSDAFALFMDELNIPNFKVTSETHVWNVIYYNNDWRHIDITWDDDENNKNNTTNFYLIKTDELLNKDIEEHSFDKSMYLELN